MNIRVSWIAYKRRVSRGKIGDEELDDYGRVVSFSMLNYHPRPYAGRVAIVQSEPPAQDLCPGDNTVGWGDLVKGKLEIHFIPDIPRHEEMFREPYSQFAAMRLAAILSEAQETSSANALTNAGGTSVIK